MNRFVLDCSATMAWLFDDEFDQEADLLLNTLQNSGASAVVSAIWRLEVGNVLLQAERRRRISADQVFRALDLLAELPIIVDAQTDEQAFNEIFDYARAEMLTTYDASYLEVAARHRIPLASRDRSLLRAAGHLGIGVFRARSDCQ